MCSIDVLIVHGSRLDACQCNRKNFLKRVRPCLSKAEHAQGSAYVQVCVCVRACIYTYIRQILYICVNIFTYVNKYR